MITERNPGDILGRILGFNATFEARWFYRMYKRGKFTKRQIESDLRLTRRQLAWLLMTYPEREKGIRQMCKARNSTWRLVKGLIERRNGNCVKSHCVKTRSTPRLVSS